jgi:hypothetical protein
MRRFPLLQSKDKHCRVVVSRMRVLTTCGKIHSFALWYIKDPMELPIFVTNVV